jgi:hypothetical protein
MKKLTTLLLLACLVIPGTTVLAGDMEIAAGKHWMSSSLAEKRAYLFGIGNLLQIERAMIGDEYQAMRGSSIVPVMLDGLADVPLEDIIMQLDSFYADNTDQHNRPVIEVLYLELALPNL